MINASTIGLVARLAEKSKSEGLAPGVAKPPTVPEVTIRKPTRRQVAIVNQTAGQVATGRPDELTKYTKTKINGARVLDMIDKGLDYYARWEEPEWRWATALWIAMTHFVDDEDTLAVPAAPIWMAIAPPKSGKSRQLTLLTSMSRDAQMLAGVITAPAVRNMKDKHMVPVLDEAHRIFKSGLAMQELQALLTSGYTPAASSGNAKGGLNLQSNFGAVALGAQPRIMTSNNADMLEDLFTRSFITYPKRHRDKIPQLDETFYQSVDFAQKALAYWGAQNAPEEPGQKLWPLYGMPDELTDRNYEISVPLIAVGDRAEDIRDEIPDGEDKWRWANRARAAALMMLTVTGNVKKVMTDIEDMNVKMDALLA
jgi:hypothetical protein